MAVAADWSVLAQVLDPISTLKCPGRVSVVAITQVLVHRPVGLAGQIF